MVLEYSPKLVPGIKAGKFGKSGKMIIKPYSIKERLRYKYLQIFFDSIKICENGCWEWQGRIHNKYGCFPEPEGNTKWAHRVSYALWNGNIDKQMHIDHKCRNPKCVNPLHLQQLTPAQNYTQIYKRKWLREKIKKEKAGQLKLW